jgi:hypothetical protein
MKVYSKIDIDGTFAGYRRHNTNISKSKRRVILFDQLMICYLILIRSKGRYLLQCAYFLVYGVIRKLRKIIKNIRILD